MSVSSLNLKVTRTTNSRIAELDKNNLMFGKQFTDHMLVCYYKNGAWQTPEIIPFDNLSMSPATSFMHYGQAIFEGIKAYRHQDGSVAIFRPQDNWKRMNVSAARLDMPDISEDIFMEGMRELIKLDEAWVPEGDNTSLYLRPFMLGMDEFIGVRTSETYAFMVIASPAGPYYEKPVRIYVQDQYVRACPGGIGFTKAAGNYGASMLPTRTVKELGYDQVLWTDVFEHKYVQEIGTMNVFFIVDGVVLTPDLSQGTILAGVTRDSIIKLLKENGIEVQERPVSIDELVAAQKAGKLQEAFGSGTAASMSYISDLTYQNETLHLPEISTWSIAPKIKKQLDDIRYGRVSDNHGWIFKV